MASQFGFGTILRSPVVSLGALLSALFSVVATDAQADSVTGTRSQELVETAHRVDVTFDRGHARLRVRRTVHNAFDRHDQAVFEISPPSQAVAVGLATLGSQRGKPHWFRGELMEAEAAAARYQELTGIGGYYPKDPALLSWRNGELMLQVFPCAPKADKQIEYTYSMPARYEAGRYRITLPPMGTQQLAAQVFVEAKHAEDGLTIDGVPLQPGQAVQLDDQDIELQLQPRGLPRIGGKLASIELEGRALTSWSVELAPELGRVPKDAYVVVVLDSSLSIEPGILDAQVAAAQAYLSHYRGAQVRVIHFDRRVHELQPEWVSERSALEDLASFEPDQYNGSDVALALRAAARLVARSPAKATRRIVLMTDALTRSSLTAELLEEVTHATSALVHIGVIGDYGAEIEPDDTHPWSEAARTTGGLVWQARLSASVEDEAQMSTAMEEWARPKRLFNVSLVADGTPAHELNIEKTWAEGSAVTFDDLTPARVNWVAIEGELWTQRVSQTIEHGAAHARRVAAHVFGSSLHEQLSEPEMMQLALLGGAVSPVTSYLAIEPGVRPSTEGLDWGLSGIGEGGGARGEGIGLGSIGTLSRAPFDPQKYLQDELGKRWRACGGSPGGARIVLETTLHEIVDVSLAPHPSHNQQLRACIEQATWDLLLPTRFEEPLVHWTVQL